MDRIRFLTHRDQRILLIDYTGCTEEEVGSVSDHVPGVVTREPKGSVLLLADFSGVKFNRENVQRLKIATALDRPHIKRAAWVLTENLPKALFDSISTFSARKFEVFDTREKAMDFLTAEAPQESVHKQA
jgi:hypothetical protein